MKVHNKFYVAAQHVTTAGEQASPNVEGLSKPVTDIADMRNIGPRSRQQYTEGKWTRPTLQAAIDHAEQILAADPLRDHVTVTKIVAIVRRKSVPVVVEKVK